MKHRVMFSPEATEQLAELYQYIALEASPEIALRYTEATINYCESLCIFPLRGTIRDDVRPGLRVTNYKKTCRHCVCSRKRSCLHRRRFLWWERL